ncbi:hypothetical protein SISNIDRAFT_448166 [Sistotremastrum niveocremeum HHB9708]|uniref:ARM repeat-containing protein n=2 Tax=Sistotremastraceae TaxID=3402574 RepID=A0A165AMK3_9AGAM|nr:hypothetical protein SISNIDRAFT_448166 [Sistotremastrum niveocremeum HHB9708]KZT42113.1 hypothetical protein SISSUDRAFT_1042059 [Sistotremastrum suecicum HHB10207 ss-3]
MSSAVESEGQQYADHLQHILKTNHSDDFWPEIESNAQKLGDVLRTRSGPVDERTVLGGTSLPETIAALLKKAYHESTLPDLTDERLAALFQLFRVTANLCMDHDANRTRFLDADIPQTVVSILTQYLPQSSEDHNALLATSISHLRVIRTALAVLINASYETKSIGDTLISLGVPLKVLELSSKVYPPRYWTRDNLAWTPETIEEWTTRLGISNWSWKLITELRDQASTPFFTESALPSLISLLQPFVLDATVSTSTPLREAEDTLQSLAETDADLIEEASTLLETLSLDVDSIRTSLADRASLEPIVDFIEKAHYPSEWEFTSSEWQKAHEKTFDLCKGALIKAVVTVAGEDQNMDTLWQTSEGETPDAWFVQRILQWITAHGSGKGSARDDLLICATLSLGNLARRDKRASLLAGPSFGLVDKLVKLLDPSTDIKVLNGAVGLLKNLSQPATNRDILGQAGVIEALTNSGVWADRNDMAELVQGFAIGVAKHLSNANSANSLRLCKEGSPASALDQILALTRRSDSVSIKSEGTRVLVNVTKSLLMTNRPNTKDGDESEAVKIISDPASAQLLAQFIARSRKFPILLNEGVIALTLIGARAGGASNVLESLLSPLDGEPTNPYASPLVEQPPTGLPPKPLDMVVAILRNNDNRFSPELRINACSLVTSIGRIPPASSEESHLDRERLKDATYAVLKRIVEESVPSNSSETALRDAARRALGVF